MQRPLAISGFVRPAAANRAISSSRLLSVDEASCPPAVPKRPQIVWAMPDPSIWPLMSAIAVTILFIWSIFDGWGVIWGAIPLAITLTIWFWPKRDEPSLSEEAAK